MECTWITGERFWLSIFYMWVRPEILLKGFIIVWHMKHIERQNQFHEQLGQGHLSEEMKIEIRAHVQCRHLQEGRRP